MNMYALLDIANPSGYEIEYESGFPVVAVAIGAVVIIAATIAIIAFIRKNKKNK